MLLKLFIKPVQYSMLRLYQSLVRPQIVQAWRPHLRKDIDLLEKVLKRATRLMVRDKSLS